MKKDEKKQAYVLCPRCELNYIKSKDKYCTVCKAEMGLVDPGILLPDDEEVGLEKLCPVCQVNYIGEDEEICFLCQKEREEREATREQDECAAMDEDSDMGNGSIGILPLDEEETLLDDEEPEEEDEMVRTEGDDDFDYPDLPDDADFEDSELDEDEEEEEDEDF